MRYILTTLLFLIFSLGITAQDVKIQGPKRQKTTMSKTKQNNSDRKANFHSNDKTQTTEKNYQEPAPPERHPQELRTETFNVNGVSFKMCYVKGGDFLMGATPEQESDVRVEKPVHKVHLEDYYIGQTEVTNALWNAVMGTSFSSPNKPVTRSYDNCIKFIIKLNSLSGLVFRLPTEEEWEFAARGGNNSKDYKYSGSNYVEDVAWFQYNSGEQLHDVATRQPNELGIFDMSGNVSEFCSDTWYLYDGSYRRDDQIERGGSYKWAETYCRVASRERCDSRNVDFPTIGLRLVLTRIPPQYREQERQKTERERQQQLAREEAERQIKEAQQQLKEQTVKEWHTITCDVNGTTFSMAFIKGGRFIMGPTTEFQKARAKGLYVLPYNTPHYVNLPDFYIGQKEVTVALWYAVMGNSKSKKKYGVDDYMVSIVAKRMKIKKDEAANIMAKGYISWFDCQTFISRLNAITGEKFYLPTEAEWEFAARGGNLSHNYIYSGSNNEDEISTRNNTFSIVSLNKSNELGLFDMSGNVSEWCQDWWGTYPNKEVTNPTGPQSGEFRIIRGGEVSGRGHSKPSDDSPHHGLRLCCKNINKR